MKLRDCGRGEPGVPSIGEYSVKGRPVADDRFDRSSVLRRSRIHFEAVDVFAIRRRMVLKRPPCTGVIGRVRNNEPGPSGRKKLRVETRRQAVSDKNRRCDRKDDTKRGEPGPTSQPSLLESARRRTVALPPREILDDYFLSQKAVFPLAVFNAFACVVTPPPAQPVLAHAVREHAVDRCSAVLW